MGLKESLNPHAGLGLYLAYIWMLPFMIFDAWVHNLPVLDVLREELGFIQNRWEDA